MTIVVMSTFDTYFILLKHGTGAIVIFMSINDLLCGISGISPTMSQMYSIYL